MDSMGDEEIEALERVADLQRRGLLTDLEAEEAKSEILGQDPATDAQVPNARKRVGLFESAASKRAMLVSSTIAIVVAIALVVILLSNGDDDIPAPIAPVANEESSQLKEIEALRQEISDLKRDRQSDPTEDLIEALREEISDLKRDRQSDSDDGVKSDDKRSPTTSTTEVTAATTTTTTIAAYLDRSDCPNKDGLEWNIQWTIEPRIGSSREFDVRSAVSVTNSTTFYSEAEVYLVLAQDGRTQAYFVLESDYSKLKLDPGETQSYTSFDVIGVDVDETDIVRALQGQVLGADDVIGEGLLKVAWLHDRERIWFNC
jgi:hypothetical protein